MSQAAFVKIGMSLVNVAHICGVINWDSSSSIGVRITGYESAITLHGRENDEFRERFQRAVDAGYVHIFDGDSR